MKVSGSGFWKRASSASGGEGKVELRRSCFALGIQEWARHISGKWPNSFGVNITNG